MKSERAAAFKQRPVGLVLLFASFLTITFARQRFLGPALLARLQVEAVTLHFLDDVFLLHLAIETAQRVLKGLTFLHSDFCQLKNTPLPALMDS
jgi:hypothetical protein